MNQTNYYYQELFRELFRELCSSKKHFCPRCPLYKRCDNGTVYIDDMPEVISLIKKWHDERTYASDFLDKFPKAKLCSKDGVHICRKWVYDKPCPFAEGKYEKLDCVRCWNEKMGKKL